MCFLQSPPPPTPEQQQCVGVNSVLSASPHWCLHSNRTLNIQNILHSFPKLVWSGGGGGWAGCVCVWGWGARNMKSIFYLAEKWRCCAVCPLADRSSGQLFEHPSWAPCWRPAPARSDRSQIDIRRERGVGWWGVCGGGGGANELTREMGHPC